jgi:hypothetical protein
VSFRDLLNPHQTYIGALTQDISAGGLRIRTDQFLSKGGRLVLEIKLPGQFRPMRAISQVAWVRQGVDNSRCDCGLEFIAVAPEDRDAIAGHVERGVLTPPPDLSAQGGSFEESWPFGPRSGGGVMSGRPA